MSSKLIRFLLSLLLFHYAVSDSLESNIDEFDDGEKLSVDDKFDSLEANIIQKLESLGRLEDLISRESKVSADSKTKLAAIEKELPDLVDKIKRTLDIVEKIPESFDRVNNRLNVLEKSTGPDTLSPRANRSTSPNSDEDVNYLENLVTKLEKDFIARNKLYNENLFKTETPELDELDSTLINITGCKYLSLKNREVQVYQMDNKTMSLVNVAYQQLSAYRHISRADFETHISIRSAGNVYILLWEVTTPELTGKLHPNYEIGLGVKDRSNNIISSLKTKNDFWKEVTPHIMSANQYNKFYVKAYDGTLEFGSRCDEAPIHVHKVKRSGRIVAIGFLSTSEDGAKILLDCPATFCADSL